MLLKTLRAPTFAGWGVSSVSRGFLVKVEEEVFLTLSIDECGGGEWETKAERLNAFLAGTRKKTRRTPEECYSRYVHVLLRDDHAAVLRCYSYSLKK